ncbi:LCP family protein [Nocardioides sp.]|uniref:LCP family protein n=1 Tax=Nocardioides sp. TaxID=35761 RepID=UPI003564ECC7
MRAPDPKVSVVSGPEQLSAQPDPRAPKRRAASSKRHTVGKVVLAAVVVLAMVTGLSVVFLYRHLNANLNVVDLVDQLEDRPDKFAVSGPQEPLNVLVMGSDTREGEGNNIDGLTGGGERSDTTILLHVSADRSRAYGISIPRDSMVDRPDCTNADGETLPGATYTMWNGAFSIGGPACTIQQFEQLTGVLVDHFVVVDFEGFKGMVDAIGGVEVCIPETIDDRAHGIYLEAGTRKLEGQEALNYVRERYAVSGGSDIGRMKRQQAFIASMAHSVVTAGTLARPDHLIRFLDSATKSLTVDPELENIVKIAKLGYQFQDIGLDNIQFLTIPNQVDPNDPNKLVWTSDAAKVWKKIARDEPLTSRIVDDVISAGQVPGSTRSPSPRPSGSPTKSPGKGPSTADAEALAQAGLCA